MTHYQYNFFDFGRIRKLIGKHMAPGPYFAHACCKVY